jgi:MFS family permease
MTEDVSRTTISPRQMLAPLALAQFICSFAGSNMNVMINDISADLDTTVQGVQLAITLLRPVMAALMIPGSKLSDRWGRKRCLTVGLVVYGVGALRSVCGVPRARRPDPRQLHPRRRRLGPADPPVYVLTTLFFADLQSRAGAFGRISREP